MLASGDLAHVSHFPITMVKEAVQMGVDPT